MAEMQCRRATTKRQKRQMAQLHQRIDEQFLLLDYHHQQVYPKQRRLSELNPKRHPQLLLQVPR
jgi:hypothetical protein